MSETACIVQRIIKKWADAVNHIQMVLMNCSSKATEIGKVTEE